MTHVRTIQRCVKTLAMRYKALHESGEQVVMSTQTIKAAHLDMELMPGPSTLTAIAAVCNSLSCWFAIHVFLVGGLL
jgi:hypothetical protein